MTDDERELDMALAEAEQENRLLRARNERLQAEFDDLEQQHDDLKSILEVERTAVRDMGNILSNYEDLLVEMKAKINQLESEQ
jgi:hypothetical protein